MRKIGIACALLSWAAGVWAQHIDYKVSPSTGAIECIQIANDTTRMDWMLHTDGTQYPWVTERYGWGLGYLTVDGEALHWKQPVSMADGGGRVDYQAGPIGIEVRREAVEEGFCERYTFVNRGSKAVRLTNLGIYTPFNDNYPSAETCMKGRCNAHIWPGGDAAYVQLLRMRGQGDGVGLMLTDGRVTDYDVWERGMDKGYSNFRGVMALCPPDTLLAPGAAMTTAWKVFRHTGTTDFYQKIVDYGGTVVSSQKYVYEVGETAQVVLKTRQGETKKDVPITKPGEVVVTMDYAGGKSTHARLLGVSSYEGLLQKRVEFILHHQQFNRTGDARDGAYMVYDNERDSIYLNDDARRSADTDESRERIGMGVLLAKWYQLHPSEPLKASLLRYARFVRTQLQKPDYTTYHSMVDKAHNRGYNYPWVADFYFRMYDITGDARYAADGYGTMKAFFRYFKYGFYAIDIPVTQSLAALRKAGMMAEHDSLLADYRRTADAFMEKGLNFPKHEVNYEQSIMAPATQFMAEAYLATKNPSYLACARMMMEPLETFTGAQPSYHMNGIAIRHWDGYWFGKRQLYGDTFPHYWSTLNATAYHYFALCTGETGYARMAENIVRNNLCQFFEDGRASCAYLAPRSVDGEPARYYDAFANDQDWALVFYLLVCHGI